MKYLILLTLILPSSLMANKPQKREFIPIPPINKKEEIKFPRIELPEWRKEDKTREPENTLFPSDET